MAHDTAHPSIDVRSRWTAGRRPLAFLLIATAVGALAAAAQSLLTEHGYRRFMLAYLVAFAFALSLSLGGLFFIFIQHLTRAGWSVLIRRFAEALAANMPLVAILFLPIGVSVLCGDGAIYPWVHSAVSGEHAAVDRGPFFSPIAFVGRWVLLLAIWSAMGLFFWRNSIRQDETRDHRLTMKMEAAAGPLALIFGLTLTFGAFDLLMSIDSHWYSTIFGIYYFSGGVVGALATIILMVVGLQHRGMLTRVIGQSHYLDLGRLLFAFVFFWGYIAFCQYMLLWYANIPETTAWLRARGMSSAAGDASAWTAVALVLLFGHFLVPFAALMSRHVKGRPALLAIGAAWMLLMHWLDLVWVVMPKAGPHLPVPVVEVGLLLAVASLYAIGLSWRLRGCSLVPIGDPRLAESAAHETVY